MINLYISKDLSLLFSFADRSFEVGSPVVVNDESTKSNQESPPLAYNSPSPPTEQPRKDDATPEPVALHEDYNCIASQKSTP